MKKVDVSWRGHDALRRQNKIGMLFPKLRYNLRTTFVPGPAFDPSFLAQIITARS